MIDGYEIVVARYLWGPFGRPLGMWGRMAPVNRMQFSSMPVDGVSGIPLFPGRPYFPEWQGFGSRDPIGEAGGINLYRFVGNSPLNAVDPLGLSEESNLGALFSNVGAFVGEISRSVYQVLTDAGVNPGDIESLNMLMVMEGIPEMGPTRGPFSVEGGAASSGSWIFKAETTDATIDAATKRAIDTLDRYNPDFKFSCKESKAGNAGWTRFDEVKSVTLFPDSDVLTLIEEAYHVETAVLEGYWGQVIETVSEKLSWTAKIEAEWEKYAESIGAVRKK